MRAFLRKILNIEIVDMGMSDNGRYISRLASEIVLGAAALSDMASDIREEGVWTTDRGFILCVVTKNSSRLKYMFSAIYGEMVSLGMKIKMSKMNEIILPNYVRVMFFNSCSEMCEHTDIIVGGIVDSGSEDKITVFRRRIQGIRGRFGLCNADSEYKNKM